MASSQSFADPSSIPPALEPAGGAVSEHRRSFATLRVIMALMLREMTTRYGRSPGGYVWAIIEPVAMIMILSVGFSLMMRAPSLGNSFIVFYASGYLPYQQYRSLEKVVTKAIPYTRGLLLYPVVTWLDAILARFFLNLLTNVLNTILIMWGVIYFTGGNLIVQMGPMVVSMVLAAVLAFGIGMLNALLMNTVAVWSSIYKIITRPLLIISAVLYIVEDVPEAVADILWYNPVVHVTGLMRTGVFTNYHPDYISVPYVLFVALVPMFFGLLFLRQRANDIVSGE